MANICSFNMKVRGNKNDIEQFYKAMCQSEKIWMGRGADADLEFVDDTTAFINGWCKWSVVSALIDNAISMRNEPNKWAFSADDKDLEFITLYEACDRWNITMEVYAEEGGCQFQEHFLCDKGEVIFEECVDWEEYWVDEYDSKEEAEEELGVTFTDEEWANRDERIMRGGFPNWDFEI